MDYWRESSYFFYTSDTETETSNKQVKPQMPDKIEMMTPAEKTAEIKLKGHHVLERGILSVEN